MKKFFGIAVLLYALLAVGSGLSLNPIQWDDLLGNDDSQASGVGQIQPVIDTKEWHPITTFEAENQTNQRTRTDVFYISSEVFRISYVIYTEISQENLPVNSAADNSPFFLIEVKKVVGEDDFLAGRCEEENRSHVAGNFEINATSGYYYLNIWSKHCDRWEVMVESLQ